MESILSETLASAVAALLATVLPALAWLLVLAALLAALAWLLGLLARLLAAALLLTGLLLAALLALVRILRILAHHVLRGPCPGRQRDAPVIVPRLHGNVVTISTTASARF